MLVLLLLTVTQAVYYPNGKEVQCLDYSEGSRQEGDFTELKQAVACKNSAAATFVGFFCNVRACAAAVKALGGEVFKWGGDGSGKFTTDRKYRKSRAGWATVAECWIEDTTYANICDVEDSQYNLYKLNSAANSPKAKVVKKNVECKSGDTQLMGGARGGVLECRNAVAKKGGKFFIFGRPRSGKELSCWMEKTSSKSCPEGWEDDGYDFWEVTKASAYNTDGSFSCAGRCGGGTSCHQPSGQCRDNPNQPMTTCRGKCAGGNCCNMNTIRCEPCGVAQAFEQAMTVTARTSTESHPSLAVNAFAVIGLGAMLYGAGRFYLSK